MTYNFHPAAESEFLSAINYYEECHIGLRQDFDPEVYEIITLLTELTYWLRNAHTLNLSAVRLKSPQLPNSGFDQAVWSALIFSIPCLFFLLAF
jgi:hypothetical protein